MLENDGTPDPVTEATQMSEAATDELAALADTLSAVLEQETAFLVGLDLASAAALLARKRDAVAALQGAMLANAQAGHTQPLDPEAAAALQDSIARMSALAEANRAAIEQGVALQARVIQAIAAAIPRGRAAEAPVYQPDGSKLPARPPEAYAFLSRM